MAGEITTDAQHDYARVAARHDPPIGYNDPELALRRRRLRRHGVLRPQSPDIARASISASDDHLNQGAGDQGLMFGYAATRTPSLMPFPIYYAHRLVQRQSEVRKDGALPWLRPDAKSQVTVATWTASPWRSTPSCSSTQHHPSMNDKQSELAEAVIEEIIKPVLPANMLEGAQYPRQPDRPLRDRRPARRLPASPAARSSSTRTAAPRRTAAARSPGKDPSKVDRSAAYAARYVAKNIVAAGLATQCQVQLRTRSASRSRSTSPSTPRARAHSRREDRRSSSSHFDLRPKGIIQDARSCCVPIY
jgi:S-adenosylmethionine synthetase